LTEFPKILGCEPHPRITCVPFLKLSSIHCKGLFLLCSHPYWENVQGSGSLKMRYTVFNLQHKGKTDNFYFVCPWPFSLCQYFRHLLAKASPYKPWTSAPRGSPKTKLEHPWLLEMNTHHGVTEVTLFSYSQLHITHSSNPTNLVWKVSQLSPE
jgi:hypothetical protein